jgi:hypothetical protein
MPIQLTMPLRSNRSRPRLTETLLVLAAFSFALFGWGLREMKQAL